MSSFAKRSIALTAAYGLVCAMFIGSIAAGRFAAVPMPICNVSAPTDTGSLPVVPQRDLTCLVSGCCGLFVVGPTPAATAVAVPFAHAPIAWHRAVAPRLAADRFSDFAARAPPLIG